MLLLLDESLDEEEDSLPFLEPDSDPLLLGLELVADLDESTLMLVFLVLSLLLLFFFVSSEVVEDGRSSELDENLDRVPLSSWLSTSLTGRLCLCAFCVCGGKISSPLGLLSRAISPEQLGQTEQAPPFACADLLLSPDCFRSMLPDEIELLMLSPLSPLLSLPDEELDVVGSRSLRMRIVSSWKK